MPSSRLYANSPIPITIIKKEGAGIFDVSILFDNDFKLSAASSIVVSESLSQAKVSTAEVYLSM